MASRQTTKKLYQTYPALKQGVEKVQQEVFGYFPQMHIRTGHQKAKKAMTGVYLDRYYLDHMDKSARKVHPEGYETELQERRTIKREFKRKKGKGPPKKGASAKKKK